MGLLHLIVSFITLELQVACNTITVAEQSFGVVHAQALISLIADIEAFDHAAELIDFLGNEAEVTLNDTLSLAVGSGYRAIFQPAARKYLRSDAGQVLWPTVKRLKLIELTEIQ
ncbi:hypothetical protein [Loktanella salsilacus]|uniref:hypothetical protein n=1 Tax=Loktanella salsilacus TaxID=195913 RepID=UPI00370389E9